MVYVIRSMFDFGNASVQQRDDQGGRHFEIDDPETYVQRNFTVVYGARLLQDFRCSLNQYSNTYSIIV